MKRQRGDWPCTKMPSARPAHNAVMGLSLMLGHSGMLAYLTYMAERLEQMHRILKPTGSIYLHCDPTASHYLKLVMDAIFGVGNFRSEIIWKRSHSHNSAKRYGPIHDVILFFTKSDTYTWTNIRQPYDPEYIERYFKFDDDDGRGFLLDWRHNRQWDTQRRDRKRVAWIQSHHKATALDGISC